MSLTSKQTAFVNAAKSYEGIDINYVNKADLQAIADSAGLKFPHWITRVPTYKVGRGLWSIPVDGETKVSEVKVEEKKTPKPKPVAEPAVSTAIEMAKGSSVEISAVPAKDPLFVPFGNFSDVEAIVKSNMFYPVFVTGLSGNGKTFMIEQACAKAKRELFRVNVTIETDEDDLLGGFRLVNGETVWFDGHVVEAMRKGAVLLLDEVDLASTKIMCLQPVLEGKGVFLKKINEWVECAEGFNIIATANTKGKGDETGNFIGAGVLNEAFLERFPITVEQEYPATAVEKKILNKVFDKLNVSDSEFVDKLVNWADIIRKTFYEGGVDELIATRRLVHIVGAYAMFRDKMKAITLVLSRFDEETKASFLDLYTKVDETAGVPEEASNENVESAPEETVVSDEELIPF